MKRYRFREKATPPFGRGLTSVLARVESRFSTLVVHQIVDCGMRSAEFHRRNRATLTTGLPADLLRLHCARFTDPAQVMAVLRKGSVRT